MTEAIWRSWLKLEDGENIGDKSDLENYVLFQLVAWISECTMSIKILVSFPESDTEVRESSAVYMWIRTKHILKTHTSSRFISDILSPKQGKLRKYAWRKILERPLSHLCPKLQIEHTSLTLCTTY
jgi:hypothetical protein